MFRAKKKYLTSLLLVGALGLFVAPVSADFVIKKKKTNGTLLTVKKTKKYLSLAGCQKLAEKKSKAAAFVLDNKEKKCIVLKSVTGWTKDPEVVSGSV